MSMQSIKQIILENPGVLQCELDAHIGYKPSGNQILKLVRRKEIVRIPATRKIAGNTFELYVVGE